jgi:hypothetical protein
MGYHRYTHLILAVFCLFFISCSQKEEKKASVTAELNGKKAMDAQ